MAAIPLYLPINQSFSVAVGNHGLTARLTYTVPVGKIAQINNIWMLIQEPAGHVFNDAAIQWNINAIFFDPQITIGAVGERQYSSTGYIDLYAGDALTIQTINVSGIVTTFQGGWNVREYQ